MRRWKVYKEGYQTTEDSTKLLQRLKDKMQDDKKLQAELKEKHPKYFIQNSTKQVQ